MPFERRDGNLYVDGVALNDIAKRVGTPTYVYSWASIQQRFEELDAALSPLEHQVCYAVKACSSLTILARLAELGAGFDIVSGGELERVLAAGGEGGSIVFSGVGKSVEEIDLALKVGIRCFNVESASELRRIEARAAIIGRRAPVSIRVNPNVDPKTHPYIATGLKTVKFGVPAETAIELYREAHAAEHLDVVGIDCHIGSQINDVAPFAEALDALLGLVDQLEQDDITLHHVDIGGGFGVTYQNEARLDVRAIGTMAAERLARRGLDLIVEPGRSLVADAGILLTRVEYLKPRVADDAKSFAIVDAAMNDLIRPALYQAFHDIQPAEPADDAIRDSWDIVGPVCESGDFLGHGRSLALAEGQLLAIFSAGAYGFVQSSNYNTRPRACEVIVDDGTFTVMRPRESVAEMLRSEVIV